MGVLSGPISRHYFRISRDPTQSAPSGPLRFLEADHTDPESFVSGSTLPEDAPSYFQKLYRKVFKRAGVRHTSHDLRHTYAATFLEAGGDIRLLSKALGHSSITVTEKFYAHFTTKLQDKLDQAAEKALAALGD